MLISQLKESQLKAVLLSGKPDEKERKIFRNLTIYPHADDGEMLSLMQSAKIVICRSGYSSLMDMVSLGEKAIFIPTPGQPEQEYLAKKLKDQGIFYSCNQKDFLLKPALKMADNFSGWHLGNDYNLLKTRIIALLEKIS